MTKAKISLLALVLLTAFLYSQYANQKPDSPADESPPGLLTLDFSQLTSVTLVGNGYTFSFLRTLESPWEMRKPIASRVSQEKFSLFLKALGQLRAIETIPPEKRDADDSQYGLEIPSLYLILRGENVSETLSIGNPHPLTQRYYAQIQSSDTIFILHQSVLEALLAWMVEVRSKRPFTFAPKDVKAIAAVTTAKTPVRLVRGEDKPWLLEVAGEPNPLKDSVVEPALQALSDLEAVSLVDGVEKELPLYGLSDGATTLQIELSSPNIWGEKLISVRLGVGVALEVKNRVASAKEAFYVKNSAETVVYRFAKDHFSVWRNPLEHFRSLDVYPTGVTISQMSVFPANKPHTRAVCLYVDDCKHMSDFFSALRMEKFLLEVPITAKSLAAFTVLFEKGESALGLQRYILYRDTDSYILSVPVSTGEEIYGTISDKDGALLAALVR